MQALDLHNITLFTEISPVESIIISILIPTANDQEHDKISRRLLLYSTLEPFMTRNAIINRIKNLQKLKYLTAFLIPLIDPSSLKRAMPAKTIQGKSGRPLNS